MSLSREERREFEDLLHALCEGLLDKVGEARLSDLLGKHGERKRCTLRYWACMPTWRGAFASGGEYLYQIR